MPDDFDAKVLGRYADMVESFHADVDLNAVDRKQVVALLRSVSKGHYMTRGRAVVRVDELARDVSRKALLRTLEIIRSI
jgi:hypothetical protein